MRARGSFFSLGALTIPVALVAGLSAGCAEPEGTAAAVGDVSTDLDTARRLADRAGWTLLAPRAERATSHVPLLAALAARADGTHTLNGLALAWTGAAGAPREADDDDAAVYRDVHPATTAVVAAGPGVVEVFYLLRDARAPERFVWRLDAGHADAGREARLAGDTIEIHDAEGAVTHRVRAPGAIDAAGARHDVLVEVAGADLVFTLAPRGALAYPVLLDPIVETTDWVLRADFATYAFAPNSTAIAYDTRRDQTILFGGIQYYNPSPVPSNQTYLLRDGAYAAQSTFPTPPPRHSAAMAYDPVRDIALLTGGNYGSDGGQYVWTGEGWEHRSITPLPVRWGVAMTWDPGAGRVRTFGGYASSLATTTSATYTFDGDGWVLDTTTTAATPASSAAFACSPTQCVAFGGYSASALLLGRTWVLEGDAWTGRDLPGPVARAGAALAYDPEHDRLVLYGGTAIEPSGSVRLDDAWEWTGAGWVAMPRVGGAMIGEPALVYDEAAGELALFDNSGGRGRVGIDGTTYRSLASGPPAYWARAVYDEARRETLFFSSGVHAWDGTRLERRIYPDGPRLDVGQVPIAYDARNAVTVVLVPRYLGALEGWTYDGTTFTPHAVPSGLTSSAVGTTSVMGYDRGRERVVLLTTDTSITPVAPLQTWEFDGASWVPRGTTGAPPHAGGMALAYDEALGRLVFTGSCQTWVYDGDAARWSRPSPFATPTTCDGHGLTYDAGRARVVLYGGYSGPFIASAFAGLVGSSWSTIPVTTAAPYRAGASLAYDRDRGRLVAFGGAFPFSGTTLTSLELFELVTSRALGSDCTEDTQCGTGHCVDGVCCDTACGGGASDDCQACAARLGAGADGTCSALSEAVAPTVTCRASESECDAIEACVAGEIACPADLARPEGTTCGEPATLRCDVADTCEGTIGASATCVASYADAGDSCAETTCAGGVATVAATCTGDGPDCPGASPVVCAPYACDATSCRTACGDDAHCEDGGFCLDGACIGARPGGDACPRDSACASGHCVDGVCCNTNCDAQCEACDVAGSLGVCTPVEGAPHGAREACVGAGSACGGACDGAERASCAFPATGIDCAAARCADGAAHAASSCDGAGACVAGAVEDCGAFACAGGACRRSCVDDGACAPGAECEGGRCRAPVTPVDAGEADAGGDAASAMADASVATDAGLPEEEAGCTCSAPGGGRARPVGLALLAPLALAGLARRRRRAR